MRRFVLQYRTPAKSCTQDSVLAAARREVPDEGPLNRMIRHALLSMLEKRQTRRTGIGRRHPSMDSSGRDRNLWAGRPRWFDQQMSSVELVRSTALTEAVPYAYAAVTPPGRLVFTAGACPLNQDGAVVSPGDIAAQAQQAMANLATALGAARAGLTDVAKTTVFVASSSRTDLVTAWQVVRDAFGDHDPPSTLLGVAVLGYPGQLVEVEAVAVIGGMARTVEAQG